MVARIIGICSGRRSQTPAFTAGWAPLRWVRTACHQLPGHTRSSVAVAARPPHGRPVSSPAALTSSATPVPTIQARGAGRAGGMSGSKTWGRTRWMLPLTTKDAATTRAAGRSSRHATVTAHPGGPLSRARLGAALRSQAPPQQPLPGAPPLPRWLPLPTFAARAYRQHRRTPRQKRGREERTGPRDGQGPASRAAPGGRARGGGESESSLAPTSPGPRARR